MMSPLLRIALTVFLMFASQTLAEAASLQVEPVLVEVTAPGAASTVTLRNVGTEPINAQIRVFRWTLVNGQEKLEPTTDVVASPPAVTLTPKGEYVARIVRVSKRPVVGEESYRLLVDQLPDQSQRKNGTINLLMRYSIPVFFGASDRKSPTVAWSLALRGDKVEIIAHNNGDRRLRISALNVRDASGKTIFFANGLAGYALGQTTKSWMAPGNVRGIATNGPVSISAQSDQGPIQAVALITKAR